MSFLAINYHIINREETFGSKLSCYSKGIHRELFKLSHDVVVMVSE